MTAFTRGDLFHELEISIPQDKVFDAIPLKELVNYLGADEILENIGKDEIIDYLNKNGYQIAEEQ